MNRSWNTGRTILYSIRNMCKSYHVILGAVICFLVLAAETASAAYDIVFYGASGLEDAYYFNIALHFGYFIWAAPLICAFAGSGVYCDAYEAGFYRQQFIRGGFRKSCLSIWFGGTVSGGTALAGGVLLFAIFQIIIFEPCQDGTVIASFDGWLPLLATKHGGLWYMLAHAGLAFLFGAVWSGFGIILSVFQPNRYVCYFSPFVLCMCAALALPSRFQPLEMLVQMRWEDFNFSDLLLYQGILYSAEYVTFHYVLKKELIQ